MNWDKNTPFWDSSLPIEKRLDWLMAEMTIEEKLSCLSSRMPDLERLNIPAMSVGGEAAHGVEARNDQNELGAPEPTTSFVQPIGMSATWDPEVIRLAGEVTGTEARVIYHRHPDRGLSRWAPTVDLERDPRWGRTEEGYGEDPFLTGEMASAYIQGMQGDHPKYLRIAATLKHFYGNNTEDGRLWKNSSIDPRNKYELYLEPFRRCIQKGKAEGVMTAYNKINGVPGVLNHEVLDILKNQYGLKHAVSDGGATSFVAGFHHYFGTHTETLAAALKAGVDAMSDDPVLVEKAAKEAWALGLITEEDVDRALRNMFGTRLKLGIYDRLPSNPYDQVTEADLDSEKHRDICHQVSREAIVLLKNNGSALPLSKDELKDAALIGPMVDAWYPDWYGGTPPFKTTLKDGIAQVSGQMPQWTDGQDRVTFTCGDFGIEVKDDGTLYIGKEPDTFIMEDWGEGSLTFRCERTGKYMNTRFYPGDNGQDFGQIAAEKEHMLNWFVMEIFGIRPREDGTVILVNRFGVPVQVKSDQTLWAQKGSKGTPFRLNVVRSGAKAAADLAREKKTVILALGCNPMINAKETVDRTTIMLPRSQEALAEEVFKVNDHVIVALFSNYPYGESVIQEKAEAILWSATGAQDMGLAMAETLAGINPPAGRLNLTWYKNDAQLPDIDDYDIIKNERTYRYFTGDVVYPFGYGLTYTTFDYSQLCVNWKNAHTFTVSFTVTNKGSVTSDEVAQVYVKAPLSRVKKPLCQLAGFKRLKQVKPGESRSVSIDVLEDEVAFYDVISSTLMVETGQYEIFAGPSSKEPKVWAKVDISGQEPGVRSLTNTIAADHYDDYENIVLTEGHFGYTGAQVKDFSRPAALVYGNCTANGGKAVMMLHMCCTGQCSVGITAGDQVIGSWQGNTREYSPIPQMAMDERSAKDQEACIATWKPVYSHVPVPVDIPQSIAEQPFTLTFTLKGQVCLCFFRMEDM